MSATMNQVVNFWDSRPCNIRHSEIDIGVSPGEYSREVSARKYRVEPHIPGFAEYPRWRGLKVFDAGCGIGTMTLDFAKAGALVTGIDVSPVSIDVARKRIEALHLSSKIELVVANLETLDNVLAPIPVSLIFSFGVIHHTPDPEMALKTLTKYMDRSSTMKLMLYHRHSWKAIWILLTFGQGGIRRRLRRWPALIAEHSEAQTGCPITWTYTKREARALLERCGLKIETMCVDHIFPYRIENYVEHRYVREWYWRVMPSRLFHWLESLLGWHILINATLA